MIDVNFDFTTDTPGYWDHFWENREGLGLGDGDPDSESATLREYHRILWSRELPNGETMTLSDQNPGKYLSWNGFEFGSDSILVSFRYLRCRTLLNEVAARVDDYHAYVEHYLRRFYTIGGMIIFPKRRNSINQIRGGSKEICDRWDLTLDCIRKYYMGEQSPLYKTLMEDKAFFDLFVNFKGYVDFFLLQDCVSEDYDGVINWMPDNGESILPVNADVYLKWIDNELDFLEKRNRRIVEYVRSAG